MKIYFFDVQDSEKKYITEQLHDLNVELKSFPLTAQNASHFSDAQVISIFLQTHITAEILNQLPFLKQIAIRATGYDNIDISSAHKHGIVVSNVPTYGENTVAEYTFGLLLALTRHIIQASERTKQLNFSCTGLMGTDLKNKTLGVIGVGNIGRHVIAIARSFEMKIIAYDIKRDTEFAHKLQFKYTETIEELLANADIITLHAPYNKHTHHLLNKTNIKCVKPGALLVNTARGGLLETNALIWALDHKIIAGAALDVLEDEDVLEHEKEIINDQCACGQLLSLARNHVLMKYPTVIMSPHNAFNTQEAINRILKTTEQNIRAFFTGNLLNVVTGNR